MSLPYPPHKVLVPYEEVAEHYLPHLGLPPTVKTPMEKWNWYYQLHHYLFTREANARLGKKPETRVRNFCKRYCSSLLLVGKIGGSEVFRHVIVPQDRYGKIPLYP